MKKTDMLSVFFIWYRLATYLSHSIPQWSCCVARGSAALRSFAHWLSCSLLLPQAAVTV